MRSSAAPRLQADINRRGAEVLIPAGECHPPASPGRGIREWGARTLSSTACGVRSVRRLFIFLERSIYENTQWSVFELTTTASGHV